MKNYRNLVPVCMVLLLLVSIYSLYDEKSSAQEKYLGYLDAARDYRAQEIYVDAEEYYNYALTEKPTLELYLELGSMYEEAEQVRNVRNLVENLLLMYPEDPETYEFALRYYAGRNDYATCFQLTETMKKRGMDSQYSRDLIAQFEYSFFFVSEYEDVGVFGRGMCPVQIGNRWGFVNEKGSQTVSARYTVVGEYSAEGIAPVVDEEGKAYYIDNAGNKKKVILNVENIQQLGMIEGDLFALYDGKVWGFYNSDGVCLFGGYEQVSNIGNGVAACMKDGKWTLLNAKGEDLTGKTYTGVVMDEKKIVYRNSRMFVEDGDGYQMIDIQGAVQGKQKYQDVRLFNDTTYAAVKIDGLWGFVDKDGKVVIPAQYEEARSFANGMAAVKVDGQWGFIDMEGNIVIEPQFSGAKDFTGIGTVYVHTGKEWEMLKLYKYNY